MIYLKDHPSVKLSNIISQHCSPRSCPATSLQALSLMNYLNISGITHDINIQTFCNICCQLLLSPSLSLTHCILALILVTICIPVALGWSELVPTVATCQACRARLDWTALFFLTPKLVCWQMIFFFPLSLPLTQCLSLPKQLPQK